MANPDASEARQGCGRRRHPGDGDQLRRRPGQPYGALGYIGSDETVAGRAAGTQLKNAGAKNAICVVQEAGNVSLEQRCAGVKQTLGGTVNNLQVDNNNLPAPSRRSRPSCRPTNRSTACPSVPRSGGRGRRQHRRRSPRTFDLNGDVAQGVSDGKILFAVDQQPYLQGYLGVTGIYLKALNGNDIGGGQPVSPVPPSSPRTTPQTS